MTIDWLSFLSVVATAVVAACVIVFLFSAGLRLVASDTTWRRPIGVLSFIVCGALILFGVYLIIPALH